MSSGLYITLALESQMLLRYISLFSVSALITAAAALATTAQAATTREHGSLCDGPKTSLLGSGLTSNSLAVHCGYVDGATPHNTVANLWVEVANGGASTLHYNARACMVSQASLAYLCGASSSVYVGAYAGSSQALDRSAWLNASYATSYAVVSIDGDTGLTVNGIVSN
jgi:hypothetical protein